MSRLVLLISLVLLAACSSDRITVSNAWVRAPLPGKSMTAGYLVLSNGTQQRVIVTGAAATGFGTTSIHQTRIDGGVARMFSMPRLELDAGEQAVFEPGGLHLMLMQPERTFAPGDTVMITLDLADGTTLRVPAVVRENAP